ncbi:MAG: type II secretion system protein [Bacilli bacterium]|nr:type II secretion system protein [Bacilli bacterium]
MKRGFTLIELIGTIVILGLILVLIVPTISNSLKKGVSDADNTTIENIKRAARNYASDNKDSTCVYVSTLQSQGYLDDSLLWPSDKTEVSGKVTIIKTTNNAGKIKYTLKYEKEGNC